MIQILCIVWELYTQTGRQAGRQANRQANRPECNRLTRRSNCMSAGLRQWCLNATDEQKAIINTNNLIIVKLRTFTPSQVKHDHFSNTANRCISGNFVWLAEAGKVKDPLTSIYSSLKMRANLSFNNKYGNYTYDNCFMGIQSPLQFI